MIRAIGDELSPFVADNEWAQSYIIGNALRISYDLTLLERFAPERGLLVDVGAIPPLLLTAAHRRHPQLDCVGLDHAPQRFATAIQHAGITIHRCDVENEPLPFKDNSVDLLIFNEIFEHMRIDLIATFRELRRVLNPSGMMLMSTPNGLAAHSITRMIRRRRIGPSLGFEYRKLERIGHMGHVREYAVNEVLDFLEDMGLAVEEIIYRGRYQHRWVDALLRVALALRPYVSFVIRKPAA